MPLGLSNAPDTFQRSLDVILSTLRWRSAIVYLDDVIVFSRSHEQRIVDMDRVLTLLGRTGVSLKFEKCSFFQERVAYLGQIVPAVGFEIDQSKTADLRNCRVPNKRMKLMSLLGLANFYRRFVQDSANTE
jgi:Reverse transcriptase (RNA-dependent DNA polymerase)